MIRWRRRFNHFRFYSKTQSENTNAKQTTSINKIRAEKMPCRRRTNMIFLFFHQILFFSRWIVHSSSLLDFFLCSLMLQTDLPSRIKCSLLSFSLVRSLDATNNIYIPFTKPFTRSIQLNCRISNFWHEKKKDFNCLQSNIVYKQAGSASNEVHKTRLWSYCIVYLSLPSSICMRWALCCANFEVTD